MAAACQVLRFYMAWDDRKSLYGELRPFVLHYYLSDDNQHDHNDHRYNEDNKRYYRHHALYDCQCLCCFDCKQRCQPLLSRRR